MSSSGDDDDDNAPATPRHYIALAALSGPAAAKAKANQDLEALELRQLQQRARALEDLTAEQQAQMRALEAQVQALERLVATLRELVLDRKG